jgi:hypothetical protein
MNLAQRENLYETPNQNLLPVNTSNDNFALDFGFNNVIYYLALFALIWSIYYFCLNMYQFNYFTNGKKAKEYTNEWRGLQHLVTSYRLIWTLLVLQFPLIFFYLGYNDAASSLLFGLLFIIFFILKILFDMTHLFKISDFFKDYQYLSVFEQVKVFFKGIFAKFTPKKEASPKKGKDFEKKDTKK